jgi:mannosyl-3-phosphoglycerate phosphatase
MSGKNKVVIFSDIDGTILDDKYSFEQTQPFIKRLDELKIPIVLVSSKTRREIQYYWEKLGLNTPFVSENGGGIFIPKHFFRNSPKNSKKIGHFEVIELGMSYQHLREKIVKTRKQTACIIQGFGDMSTEEIANATGLPLELATLAKKREYSEPICAKTSDKNAIYTLAEKEKLKVIWGKRFHHLIGDHDKGKAVNILKGLFGFEFGDFHTFAIGNGENDISMFKLSDRFFFVSRSQELGVAWTCLMDSCLAITRQ